MSNTIHAGVCITRYHGPTDHRGSRISARHVTTGRKVTLPWDHAIGASENHERAARELFSFDGAPFCGVMVCASRSGTGEMVFACVPRGVTK